MRKVIAAFGVLLMFLVLSGCLTVGREIYHFKIKPDGTGEGSITFVDLRSQDEDGDVSLSDFQTLLDDYVEGTNFEEVHKTLKVYDKKLYEKDGKLCGEIKFGFDRPADAGFLKDAGCDCAPYYYFTGSLDGEVVETNGENLLSTGIRAIRWDADTREFTFTVLVMDDTTGTRSLVDYYREWKKDEDKGK